MASGRPGLIADSLMYANENATQRGNTGRAIAGTVASAAKFLLKGVFTDDLSRFPLRSRKPGKPCEVRQPIRARQGWTSADRSPDRVCRHDNWCDSAARENRRSRRRDFRANLSRHSKKTPRVRLSPSAETGKSENSGSITCSKKNSGRYRTSCHVGKHDPDFGQH